MHTPSGNREMTVISEPGLYSLILRSRKPEAEAFKRWVTHEVLPSILVACLKLQLMVMRLSLSPLAL